MNNETMKVIFIYDDENMDEKELVLNQIELNALMHSNCVGSQGNYFEIDKMIFEDCEEEKCLCIRLRECKSI